MNELEDVYDSFQLGSAVRCPFHNIANLSFSSGAKFSSRKVGTAQSSKSCKSSV